MSWETLVDEGNPHHDMRIAVKTLDVFMRGLTPYYDIPEIYTLIGQMATAQGTIVRRLVKEGTSCNE